MNKAVVGGIAVVVVAVGAFFLLRTRQEPPPPVFTPPVPPPVARAPDVPLPPTADSDAKVHKALSPLSKWPVWEKWLEEGDLLNRWVVIADNLAEDVSPRKQLASAAPESRFSVLEKKGAVQLDPKSYQRYDLFTEVVDSIDAREFTAAVRDLHPLLEAAYHKLGYPDRKLDDLARKALQRLIDSPIVEGPIELTPKGAVYKFADEKLEALGPIEKHLLRMGPRNTRVIKAKAQEVMVEMLRR